MYSKRVQAHIQAVLGIEDLDAFLSAAREQAEKASLPADLKRTLGKLWALPDLLRALEGAAHGDMNLRYNEMISEVASLVRDSLDRQRLKNEMNLASAVQKALMPPSTQDYDQYSVSGRCYPAESCGGDWWFHARKGDRLLVWIGDVLGHDIAAALVASACRATVSTFQAEKLEASVEQQMAIMNDVIYSMTKGEVYLTAICMEIDLRTGLVDFCCASHPPTILVADAAKKESGFLEAPMDPPLGQSPGQTYRRVQRQLAPGQALFMMTDGLMEIPREPRTHWSETRLVKLLSKGLGNGGGADGIIQALEEVVFSIGSGSLADDVTYVAVHRKAS